MACALCKIGEMAELRLKHDYVTGQFAAAARALRDPIARAATATIRDGAKELLTGARARIASAGFPRRWQIGFSVQVFPRRGASIDAYMRGRHRLGFAQVFQRGAHIAGKPLLWIPLSGIPDKIGTVRMTPRNFISKVGPLHTINVPGKAPLLAAYMRGRPGAKFSLARVRAGSALARLGVRRGRSDSGGVGVISVPIFVGVTAVQLRRRFDVAGVYEKVRRGLPANYFRHIREEVF